MGFNRKTMCVIARDDEMNSLNHFRLKASSVICFWAWWTYVKYSLCDLYILHQLDFGYIQCNCNLTYTISLHCIICNMAWVQIFGSVFLFKINKGYGGA